MLARNQPGNHACFVRERCSSQSSPIVHIRPWTPMPKCVKCHRSMCSNWHLSLPQWIQHQRLPFVSYLLAKLGTSVDNLWSQKWISVDLQFPSVVLIHCLHWVDVHRKHLQKLAQSESNDHQIFSFSPYLDCNWIQFVLIEQIVPPSGATKCENEVFC